ncbi:MAG: hypothetical protein COU10_00555 [Candidatus Harrisonbacteria bacterium CG10_big_fil_rev_8_21_14_0_10_45_28]|uniref:Uncharacterized protein n=1 Tax=Candidatus Harrisonbacteria bacterium CG10_big_fil_rev_8_21_14_0_10_45_28 TaxID=1974586 RepID=A0A2H0UP54_9BACT|nr:MAG: hypothetical protein COU10_00555 [Candidatus Harrisonbacteria bacterium CG10_big_fil_rev_8_21_14_0_10_45_28]
MHTSPHRFRNRQNDGIARHPSAHRTAPPSVPTDGGAVFFFQSFVLTCHIFKFLPKKEQNQKTVTKSVPVGTDFVTVIFTLLSA